MNGTYLVPFRPSLDMGAYQEIFSRPVKPFFRFHTLCGLDGITQDYKRADKQDNHQLQQDQDDHR